MKNRKKKLTIDDDVLFIIFFSIIGLIDVGMLIFIIILLLQGVA